MLPQQGGHPDAVGRKQVECGELSRGWYPEARTPVSCRHYQLHLCRKVWASPVLEVKCLHLCGQGSGPGCLTHSRALLHRFQIESVHVNTATGLLPPQSFCPVASLLAGEKQDLSETEAHRLHSVEETDGHRSDLWPGGFYLSLGRRFVSDLAAVIKCHKVSGL